MMKVVLLLGSSSAGKSTLCGELASKYQWKVASTDDFGEQEHKKAKANALPLIESALHQTHLSDVLLPYMTLEQIVHLVMTGELKCAYNSQTITHQFPNPELPQLEKVLQKLAIKDALVAKVADQLRDITKLNMPPFVSLKDFLTKFFDHALSKININEDTVIIDIVPHPDAGPAIISDLLTQRIKHYRNLHPEQSVELFKVLAYCKPQALSARIHQRNVEAEASGNLSNKRVGLFPIEQLSQLVNAHAEKAPKAEEKKWHAIARLSRKDVFDIATKHFNPELEAKLGEKSKPVPVLIVEPVDPFALQSNNIDESHDLPKVPLVAVKPVVEAYSTLIQKFGFCDDKTHADLCVASGVRYDAMIDTSEREASILADELYNKIDAITQERIAPKPR